MRTALLVAAALAISIQMPVKAQTATSFADADRYVASIPDSIPGMATMAIGDLNSDGTEDLAIVVVTRETNRNGQHTYYQQLLLLTKNKAGQFIVAETSEKIVCGTVDSKLACFVENMYIKDQSLYVKGVLAGSCSSMQATHQFKYYGGAWRLIGKKRTEYGLRCSSSADRWQEVDFNLLTSSSIEHVKIDQEPVRTYKGKYKARTYFLKDYPFNIGFGE